MLSFNVDSISYVEVSICEFNDAHIEVRVIVGNAANKRFSCPSSHGKPSPVCPLFHNRPPGQQAKLFAALVGPQ
jgi:hypothetical protein